MTSDCALTLGKFEAMGILQTIKQGLRAKVLRAADQTDSSEDIGEVRGRYGGYRAALETLQAEAIQLRWDVDGYRGAYETACKSLALAQDDRDRILRSLEKLVARNKLLLSPLGEERQICFMHIGKTAGTSLQHALFEAMSDGTIFHESLPNFDRASPAEIAINDLVIGHFAYQHVVKLREKRFMVTFLRDPVARVISNYRFLKTDSPVSDYSKVAIEAAKALSLRDFLLCEHPGVRMVTQNFQAKTLAHDFRPEYQSAITDLHRMAKENLSTFDFVGIVEYFDASVRALSDAIGVGLAIKKLNVSEAILTPPASSDEIDLIRGLNKVDIALYLAAREKYETSVLRAQVAQQTLSVKQLSPAH